MLDEALADIAAREYEQLAPAIDRVWHDEIAAIRRDLRLWVDEIAGWRRLDADVVRVELRLDSGAGRDEASRPEPVVIDGRFSLHGSIDLVEEHANGDLRVTDHKTGKYRGKDHMVVDGGAALQPVLYSLALEAATGRSVVEGRLVLRDHRRRISRRPHSADAAGAPARGSRCWRSSTARSKPASSRRRRGRRRARGATSGPCADRPPSTASAATSPTSRWPISSTCGGSHDAAPTIATGCSIRDGLDETVIVEAAAGTGKTTELVWRILNVLGERPRAHRSDRRRHLHRESGGRAEAAHQAGAGNVAPAGNRCRSPRAA